MEAFWKIDLAGGVVFAGQALGLPKPVNCPDDVGTFWKIDWLVGAIFVEPALGFPESADGPNAGSLNASLLEGAEGKFPSMGALR